MNTSLAYYPDREQRLLKAITHNIVMAVNPEYLFCYGSHTEMSYWESCFTPTEPSCRYENHYDLAVIVNDRDTRPLDELQLLTKAAVLYCADVDVQAHRMTHVCNRLLEGDGFFSLLFEHGTLLHGAKRLPTG